MHPNAHTPYIPRHARTPRRHTDPRLPHPRTLTDTFLHTLAVFTPATLLAIIIMIATV